MHMRKNESSMVELDTLHSKSDENIDFSDIPELDEAFWMSATRAASKILN